MMVVEIVCDHAESVADHVVVDDSDDGDDGSDGGADDDEEEAWQEEEEKEERHEEEDVDDNILRRRGFYCSSYLSMDVHTWRITGLYSCLAAYLKPSY